MSSEYMKEFVKICTPGENICVSNDCKANTNCYILERVVRASVAGKAYKISHEDKSIEVLVDSFFSQCVVPAPDSLVTVKITKVNLRMAKCLILMVDGLILDTEFHGCIRKEDVRAKEKDKVDMYKCFRPCDIVMAKVISYGDSSDYLLSTAENELGVIQAASDSGDILIPISWTEFQNIKTGKKEFRKVAKIQPDYQYESKH